MIDVVRNPVSLFAHDENQSINPSNIRRILVVILLKACCRLLILHNG